MTESLDDDNQPPLIPAMTGDQLRQTGKDLIAAGAYVVAWARGDTDRCDEIWNDAVRAGRHKGMLRAFAELIRHGWDLQPGDPASFARVADELAELEHRVSDQATLLDMERDIEEDNENDS